MSDPRLYPDRPFLAVSAAIIRGDRILHGLPRARREHGRVHRCPAAWSRRAKTLRKRSCAR